MTYQQSCADALKFFDAEHEKRLAVVLEIELAHARVDRWALALFHLRSLMDKRYADRLAKEPELIEEIHRKIV